MSVGEYAGVPLQDSGDNWRNGAVFLLRKKPQTQPPPVSLHGWVTSIVGDVVITCGPSNARDFDGTFAEALNAANRGLDYMSVRGQAHAVIKDALDECLVWWPEQPNGDVVVRCRVVHTIGISFSFTVEVRDKDGNVRPSPPPPTPLADDVFRFVRISRTSDDLFDSYRNLFLAFESLLSDIRPRRQVPVAPPSRKWWHWRNRSSQRTAMKWETEETWFMDALDLAHQKVSLDQLTPANVTNHKKWIYRHVYQTERSALMHAKRGQNYLLPHDAASRIELTESLGRLWIYVRDLIEEHFGVQCPSGGPSLYTVKMGATGVLPSLTAVVSDDDSGSLNPNAENLLSPGAKLVELQSSAPVVDPVDPELWTVLSKCESADIGTLEAIRRFAHKRGDGSGICDVVSELVGPLALGDDVGRVEMLYGLRHVNPTGPPRRFSS